LWWISAAAPGFYALEMARRAARTVAVDVSRAMLAKARRAAGRAGRTIETVESDGTRLPLEEVSVDVIFVAWVWHEVGRKEEVLQEFRRVLKPGGRLIIVENVKFPIGPPRVDAGELLEQVQASGFGLQQRVPSTFSAILVLGKSALTPRAVEALSTSVGR
jgi:ubiquinone/menaquinone biosynthesis C-methylase UbiE